MTISTERTHELHEKLDKAENKLQRIKREATEAADKVMIVAGAAVLGGAYGALTTRQGGNAVVPYMVAGKVPLDTALAIVGTLATLALPEKEEAAPFVYGASAAAIGICTARLGAQWETTRLAAAGTPATNPTNAPSTTATTTSTTTTPASTSPGTATSTTQGPIRRQQPRRFVAAYG
jgi:hypothetical protein